jgi:heme exporter protein B
VSLLAPALTVASADLRAELRRPEGLARLLVPVLAGGILIGAALGAGPEAREALPALLWVLLLFGALLAAPALGEPAVTEGLLASGVHPGQVLLGRALSSALLLVLGGFLLLALLLFFVGYSGGANPGAVATVLLLGGGALAAAVTPASLLLQRSRARGALLPLLAAPLLLPLVLAAVAGLREGLAGSVPVPELSFLLLFGAAVALLSHRIASHVLEVE